MSRRDRLVGAGVCPSSGYDDVALSETGRTAEHDAFGGTGGSKLAVAVHAWVLSPKMEHGCRPHGSGLEHRRGWHEQDIQHLSLDAWTVDCEYRSPYPSQGHQGRSVQSHRPHQLLTSSCLQQQLHRACLVRTCSWGARFDG